MTQLHGPSPTPPPMDGAAGAVAGLNALEATELQDHLLVSCNDLDRLQRLLDGTCNALLDHFSKANALLDAIQERSTAADIQGMRLELAGAITGLQFQDMASQLIAHTVVRLRSCADRLAQRALSDDEDGTGVVTAPPLRPNPVTQDEMDAGSVELF